MIWLLFGLLALGAAAALVWPLLRPQRSVGSGGAERVGVYAEQLAEIEREVQDGLIPLAEAEAARAEIGRRLLRSARPGSDVSQPSTFRIAAVALIALLVPMLSLGFYADLGRPGYDDQPRASRLLAAGPTEDLPQLLARAEQRLRDVPDDGVGWAVVAPIYLSAQRFDDAVEAYRNANRLLGEDADRLSGLGEALTLRAQGVVGDAAREAFSKALALSPDAIAPQIYLAIAARQAGRTGEARMAWDALVARAEGGEPWLALAQHELALLDRPGPSSPLSRAAAGDDGERQTTSASAAAAPAQPRGNEAMVEGMVSRLAQRLEKQGGSAEEYIRLARSYVVLGRPDEARRAIESGLVALEAEPEAGRSLRDAAKALGLALN